ncbi:MAG: putative alpha/beta superfamily hydrolase [Flavobacteriales bacterium]|jgi:predicted alpha/beta superfamily hydrolase
MHHLGVSKIKILRDMIMNIFSVLRAYLGFACLLTSMMCVGEISIVKQAPVTIGAELVLKSSILKKEITIKISVPDSFEFSSVSHSYPIIFIVGAHGNEFFHAVSGMVKHLADVERMPETLVVGISGDNPSPDIYHNGMWGEQEHDKWSSWGEPAKYNVFYKKELLPFLKARYRANDSRTVVGISGGSFFPLHNLTQTDNLFDTYVFLAAADVIGMGYSPDSTLIDALVTRLTDDSKVKPMVFFAVASDDVNGDKRYQANVDELASRLSHVKKLPFSAKVYENEGHYDALLKAMLDVIELKYPKHIWSARYRDIVAKPGNALENLDKYYKLLSERYGFAIHPRATRWNGVNRLGFISTHLINLNRAEEAVEVARRYTQYQAKSWQAYEALAKALEANGNIVKAIVTTKIALELTDTDMNRIELQKYLVKLNAQVVGD